MFKRSATLALLMACSSIAAQQPPSNLGFELRDAAGRPIGWGMGGAGFQIGLDSVAPFAGAFSLRIKWTDTSSWTTNRFGVVSTGYPVALARGRKLHLSGYIRTENVTAGYAGFWIRVDAAPGRMIVLDNMQSHGATATTPWTRYDMEVPVDSGAAAVTIGMLHPGNGTAWYDSLTLEVVGPAMPRTVSSVPLPPPYRPDPRPTEISTRLLTDSELAPAPATPPPAENPDWAAWVRAHAHPIRSLEATDFSDLKFFEPLLKGKRIVQLGESGHGVAEFEMAKVRLIKYLHESLGYDVIAFESSVFECHRAEHDIATLTADQLMRNCIFGVWHTAEVLPLFEYIKQTQSTAHPLILAGFDEQTSAPSADKRPRFFYDLIARVDTAYAKRVLATDSAYMAEMRLTDHVALTRDIDHVVAFYDSLATWLRAHERALSAGMPSDADAAKVARQTAISMTIFPRQLIAGAGSTNSTALRDHGMADNLDFLLNELYPKQKVMVWAHNFHIQHRDSVSMTEGASPSGKSMGAWTMERHHAELYTIGLFMYQGGAANNVRMPYPVAKMAAGSLESVMHSAPWRYSFVDMSAQRPEAGTSWMFSRIGSMTWGTGLEQIVPRNEYEGILFIETTHVPRYLPFPAR